MRPSYQAPNLQRKASSFGNRSNVIDVKGTSTNSEMVPPTSQKTGFVAGAAGMVSGTKEMFGGVWQKAKQRVENGREEQIRKAKRAEAEKYEKRAQSRRGR